MREIYYRSPLFDVPPDGWDHFEDDRSFSEGDRKNAADNERNARATSILSLSGTFSSTNQFQCTSGVFGWNI